MYIFKLPLERVFVTTGKAFKHENLKFFLLLVSLDRYFHKVPAEPPQLDMKASYGLAEPVPFELPPLSEQCTPEVYATFDLTKGAKNNKVHTKSVIYSRLFHNNVIVVGGIINIT